MSRLKHLPVALWPADDHRRFEEAYRERDIFDEVRSPGQHFASATRNSICFAWRRWLGFLVHHYPEDLLLPADERITSERLRAYVEYLRADLSPCSVASTVAHLYDATRLAAPDRDWSWLKALKTRLQARAEPSDRFEHLVPPHLTLDLGIKLMDAALDIPLSGRREREVQYRDGLILAMLSLWPIRRRSIAALTVSRHLTLHHDSAEIKLFAEDTKAKRAESCAVPDALLPYLTRYIREIRPRLLGRSDHDAFWPSMKGGPLRGNRIYTMVRAADHGELRQGDGPARLPAGRPHLPRHGCAREDRPRPRILQHAGPDVGRRFYNLARSTNASRRHVGAVAAVKAQLRSGRWIE